MNKRLFGFAFSSQKGFTLIELLVVLGILGILAAALLAAINPIEQLNKAQDTSLKNAASEFVNAATQYYSVHNTVEWDSATNGGSGCYSTVTFNNIVLFSPSGGGLSTCVTNLVSEGELKSSYTNASNLANIYVTSVLPAGTTTYATYACFQPKSNAQQLDPNTKYTQTGAPGTSCKSQGGSNNCYWCAQ